MLWSQLLCKHLSKVSQFDPVSVMHCCFVCSQPYLACCQARKRYFAGKAAQTVPAVSLIAWFSYHTHTFVVVGDKAEASRTLQPYTDYLVYSAVIALPWLAPELQHLESDPEGLTTFSSSVEQYLSIRPRATQDALNPFPVANEDENVASLGDGGGASFLPQVCCT